MKNELPDKFLLKITQEDIDRARELNKGGGFVVTHHCPLALASARILKTEVSAGTRTIIARGKVYHATSVSGENKISRFTDGFDSREDVEPIAVRMIARG